MTELKEVAMTNASKQIGMVSVDDLVSGAHPYRVYQELLPMAKIMAVLSACQHELGRIGYGIERLFYSLLLQYMKDLSDRELECHLQENMASRLFCRFGLTEKTPDHTVFTKVRQRIGTKRLAAIFTLIQEEFKEYGYLSELFTFVDATHLIAKANLWKERDAALAAEYEQFNNEILPKVAADQQARIGCKGKGKFWYGYKQQVSVDMQSGLIQKVAITPANETDAQGFKRVCPNQGAVYADKGYCTTPAVRTAAAKGVHLAAIKKNNMKAKNWDQDRYYSKLRSPYERVFAQRNQRVRYHGLAKNQFAAFFQAISFNLKRFLVLQKLQLAFSTG